jgi:serine/threonine protein kinase
MAPEALKSRHYSEASDAYSFGVLLWYALIVLFTLARMMPTTARTHNAPRTHTVLREMVVRSKPWAGMEAANIVEAVTSNTRPKIPRDCDPIFKKIIGKCWKQNPAQR